MLYWGHFIISRSGARQGHKTGLMSMLTGILFIKRRNLRGVAGSDFNVRQPVMRQKPCHDDKEILVSNSLTFKYLHMCPK